MRVLRRNIFSNGAGIFFIFLCGLSTVLADEAGEVQDMSDPLAVYTQAGIGYTDKGLNIKIGKSYDSGQADVMAMNVIEIKGIYGDTLGTRDNLNDSADIIRFRNFSVDTKTGQGTQIDAEFNLNNDAGSASYAFIQSLPKKGRFQFYPFAGAGLAVANNVNKHSLWGGANSPSGFSIPGVYALIGMYSKVTITEEIWFNYNPVWLTSLSGSEGYTNNTYGVGEDSVFTHEIALSYQLNPQMNIRYFGNWSELTDFSDGDQRIEFNYQL
ncbi:MAG: hypothetical protein ACC707_05820 [Thiohalomonadales bacterium]